MVIIVVQFLIFYYMLFSLVLYHINVEYLSLKYLINNVVCDIKILFYIVMSQCEDTCSYPYGSIPVL